jgi:general secretion pathway protein G
MDANMKQKVRVGRMHPEAGVTLVEMMVVIVIIGLVTAIVAINVLPAQDKARTEKARADIAGLENALQLYRLNTGRFPTTDEGLEALLASEQGGESYIRRLPKDPWGRDYLYVVPGQQGGAYDLYSLGADAKEGGEGSDADVGNWQ